LQRAKNKMVLDHLVIQTMGDGSSRSEFAQQLQGGIDYKREELAAVLRFGAKDLFEEDEKRSMEQHAKSIEQMNIDDILARAETRTEETSSAGGDLLNAFKVANFSVDQPELSDIEHTKEGDGSSSVKNVNIDNSTVSNGKTPETNKQPSSMEDESKFWSHVIPKEAIVEQENKDKPLLYLPPRRKNPVQSYLVEATSDPHAKKKSANKKKPASKQIGKEKLIVGHTDTPSSSGEVVISSLKGKELRQFVQSFMRFGQRDRISEIREDAKLVHYELKVRRNRLSLFNISTFYYYEWVVNVEARFACSDYSLTS